MSFSSDQIDHRFDRSYGFDHAGRINAALSGAEARGEPATTDRPYWQTYGYDAIGHLTERATYQWSSTQQTSSDSYTNNRHNPVGSLWQYDADGNLLGSPGNSYTYDAAGRVDTLLSGSSAVLGLDGDGRQVRSAETVYDPQTQTETTTTKYYVRSTMLGGEVLTETEPANGYSRSFVYAGGAVLATQERWFSQTEQISWEHRDPSNASFRMTSASTVTQRAELDPVGANAGLTDGSTQSIPDQGSLAPYPSFSSGSNLFSTYSWDGIPMPVDEFMQTVNQLFHGRLGLAEALAKESANDANYQKRRIGPPGDSREETSALLVLPSLDWFTVFDPQKPTTVGGQLITVGPVATFDLAKFDKCLHDLFGVDTGSVKFNGTRSGGNVTGTRRGKPFSVSFDTTSKTQQNLNSMVKKATGRTVNVLGLTVRGANSVYVASDVARDPNILSVVVTAVEVHEAGNDLANRFIGNSRLFPKAKSKWLRRLDRDPGMANEECTFGGAVSLPDGRVSTNP